MAIRTNVPIEYQTPYLPSTGSPGESVLKTMKREIKSMTRDLLIKQQRMGRSIYKPEERLISYLKDVSKRNLKSPSTIQNQWSRLYNLEHQANSSVTGKREADRQRVETLSLRSELTMVNRKGNPVSLDVFLNTAMKRKIFLEYLGEKTEEYGNQIPYPEIIQTVSEAMSEVESKNDAGEITNDFGKYLQSNYPDNYRTWFR